jgi:hypothetical protein
MTITTAPVAGEPVDLANSAIPSSLCYERAGTDQWCHRALATRLPAKALGEPVPTLAGPISTVGNAQMRLPEGTAITS